jgi:hypothetical protein
MPSPAASGSLAGDVVHRTGRQRIAAITVVKGKDIKTGAESQPAKGAWQSCRTPTALPIIKLVRAETDAS